MMTNLLITLVFLAIIAVFVGVAVCVKEKDIKTFFISAIFVAIVLAIITVIVSISEEAERPTALDVYQGKTTLKYTVVDSVITDSTVIFRKEDL